MEFLWVFSYMQLCAQMQVFEKLIHSTMRINFENSAICLYLNVTSMAYINAIQQYTKLRRLAGNQIKCLTSVK
jgi:hypothetical protein